MDAGLAGAGFFVLVLLLLASGVWIFAALFIASGLSLFLIADFPISRIEPIFKGVVWSSITSYQVAAVPLFIWMGEIIFRTDLSDRLFRGLVPFVNAIPGRLLHTNVLGCTLFAAVSGSSVATTATVGRITTTALLERNYDRNLSIGSLAGAGSLGMMIPPSILLIIYGLLGEVSVAKLFIAGILPGLLIAGMYIAYIGTVSAIWPFVAPSADRIYTWKDRLASIGDLAPVVALIVIVLGGIYSGIVTPSEAAAIGVLGALAIALAMRQLSWDALMESLLGTISTSCMILSLLISAAALSSTMSFMHIPTDLARIISDAELSPYGLMLMLGVFYIFLGMFLDGISIIVITLPITLPLTVAAGFDPVWFGIFLVIMAELAVITPPVGFNLFVLQSLTGESLHRVAWAAFPFFLLMVLAAVIVTAFPGIALWLPSLIE